MGGQYEPHFDFSRVRLRLQLLLWGGTGEEQFEKTGTFLLKHLMCGSVAWMDGDLKSLCAAASAESSRER